MSKNTNCLEGIRCPSCGNEDGVHIEVKCWADVSDNGIETYGDNDWNKDSACQCNRCNHEGKVFDFCVVNQGKNAKNEQGKLVVKIEVRGGVAEVTSQPDNVFVEINDHDNEAS